MIRLCLLAFPDRTASHDPAEGLVVTIPVRLFDPSIGGGLPQDAVVSIDPCMGEIISRLIAP